MIVMQASASGDHVFIAVEEPALYLIAAARHFKSKRDIDIAHCDCGVPDTADALRKGGNRKGKDTEQKQNASHQASSSIQLIGEWESGNETVALDLSTAATTEESDCGRGIHSDVNREYNKQSHPLNSCADHCES
jgi:hypothetical protein